MIDHFLKVILFSLYTIVLYKLRYLVFFVYIVLRLGAPIVLTVTIHFMPCWSAQSSWLVTAFKYVRMYVRMYVCTDDGVE